LTHETAWVADIAQYIYDPESKEEYPRHLTWKLAEDVAEQCGISAILIWPHDTLRWLAGSFDIVLDGTHFRTTANLLRAVAEEFYAPGNDDYDWRDYHSDEYPFDAEEIAAIEELVEHSLDDDSDPLPRGARTEEEVMAAYLANQEILTDGDVRAREAAARLWPETADVALVVTDEENYIVQSDDALELAFKAQASELIATGNVRPRVITLDFPRRAVEKYGVRGVRFAVRDYLLWQAYLSEQSGLYDECPDPVNAASLRQAANTFYADWVERVAARKAYRDFVSAIDSKGTWSAQDREHAADLRAAAGLRDIEVRESRQAAE
jgi:hypothetical protein